MANIRDRIAAQTADLPSVQEIMAKNKAAGRKPADRVPTTAPGMTAELIRLRKEVETLTANGGGGGLTKSIQLEQLSANPWQPRKSFPAEDLKSLAESIAEVGQLQPVLVRPVGEDQYQLIAGERRLRAIQLLGQATITAVVRDVSDADMAMLALAENISRAELCDYEVFLSISAAESTFATRAKFIEAVGFSRAQFYRYMGFKELPPVLLEILEEEPTLIGLGAATTIVNLGKKHISSKVVAAIQANLLELKRRAIDDHMFARRVRDWLATGGAVGKTSPIVDKLFRGKNLAGSIKKTSTQLTLSFKLSCLTTQDEEKLRAYANALFNSAADR